MVVGLPGNESPDGERFTLVYPKSENDVRLQGVLGSQNPTGLPVGVVSRSGASDDDIRCFQEMATRNKDAAYQKSVDDILQVSVSANKESYARLMKEDPAMCEALRDLMKEDFEKAEERGEARGEIKGTIKLYRDELNLMPAEIIKRIMVRFNLEKPVAEKYVEETLRLKFA